ncbi:hypothetical protein LLB_3705 [Legionella longbeachae D-4968]|nr:hypothetical protein LLB_3705 [Legionella longbeachae D-4968]
MKCLMIDKNISFLSIYPKWQESLQCYLEQDLKNGYHFI